MESHPTRPAFAELQKSLNEGNSFAITRFCRASRQDLQQAREDPDPAHAEAELRYLTAMMQRIERTVSKGDPFQYAVFELGSLHGAVDVYDAVLYQQQRAQWAVSHFTQQKVKHLPEIVRALETHGSMSHTELSSYLDMNSSTLSEAMKKILPTGAIDAAYIGKFKMYSLTDAGLAYGKELRKRMNWEFSLQELCLHLKALSSQAKTEADRAAIQDAVHACMEEDVSAALHFDDKFRLYDQATGQVSPSFQVREITNITGVRETFVGVRRVSDAIKDASDLSNYSDPPAEPAADWNFLDFVRTNAEVE